METCHTCGTRFQGWSCPACNQREKDERRHRERVRELQKNEESLAERHRAIQDDYQEQFELQQQAYSEHLFDLENANRRAIEEQEELIRNRPSIEAAGQLERAREMFDASLYKEALRHAKAAIECDATHFDAYILAARAENHLGRPSYDVLSKALKLWKSSGTAAPNSLLRILFALPPESPLLPTVARDAASAAEKWPPDSKHAVQIAIELRHLGFDRECEAIVASLAQRGASPVAIAAHLCISAARGNADYSILANNLESESVLKSVSNSLDTLHDELPSSSLAAIKAEIEVRLDSLATRRKNEFLRALPTNFLNRARSHYEDERRGLQRELEGKFHWFFGLLGCVAALYLTKFLVEYYSPNDLHTQAELLDVLTTILAFYFLSPFQIGGLLGHTLVSLRPLLRARTSYRQKLSVEMKAYKEHLPNLPHGYPRFTGVAELAAVLRSRLIPLAICAVLSTLAMSWFLPRNPVFQDLRNRWTGDGFRPARTIENRPAQAAPTKIRKPPAASKKSALGNDLYRATADYSPEFTGHLRNLFVIPPTGDGWSEILRIPANAETRFFSKDTQAVMICPKNAQEYSTNSTPWFDKAAINEDGTVDLRFKSVAATEVSFE